MLRENSSSIRKLVYDRTVLRVNYFNLRELHALLNNITDDLMMFFVYSCYVKWHPANALRTAGEIL